MMRTHSTHFLAFICLCLLALQVSGMHLHTSQNGAGELHATHVHGADPDGQNHAADVDLSYLEYATSWVKPMPVLLFAVVLFVFFSNSTQRAWGPLRKNFRPYNHLRWRPPLRAPPVPVS